MLCPGYKATSVITTSHGYTAELELAGLPCNLYRNDIFQLSLIVEYQNQQRVNVRIEPRFIAPSNVSQYILPAFITGLPGIDDGAPLANHNLKLTYFKQPSFQFTITRGEEILFSTLNTKIIFEDQFLEVVTSMVANHNAYGLAERIGSFRLGTNSTVTFYAADDGNPIDGYSQMIGSSSV